MAGASFCGSTIRIGSGRARNSSEGIREDLAWLGLVPDEEHRQSARFDRYDAALERLKETGRVYPAYETAQELELKRKVLLGRGKPPVYDRAALASAMPSARGWRRRGGGRTGGSSSTMTRPIEWTDLIRGPQHFDPALLSDPVVRREDGSWLYMLPSTVDDIELGVTHVVRGEDHVTNTALQIQMFEALGAPPPAFAHEALLVGSEGKLSKRLGSLGVDAMREAGIEPAALVAKLARIGTSLPVEPVVSPEALIESFDFSTFGRAPARFDLDELTALSAKVVHQLPFDAVAGRLPARHGRSRLGGDPPEPAQLSPKRRTGGRSSTAMSKRKSREEDRPVIAAAAEAADALDWSAEPWRQLVAIVKERTGRGGKPLFLPLRRALTGRDSGPEMAALLPLIGRDEALARLNAAL